MTRITAVLAFLVALAAAALPAATPRFYRDDPIAREPERQNASGAQPEDIALMYELGYNLFAVGSRLPSGTRARNINTTDEVPDSSWFTNRLVTHSISSDEVLRGPNTGAPPNPEHWTLIREKSAGYAPGFTAKDANGETWFISFDPPRSPEGATGAMVVATKLFWALGYNQTETFLTTVDLAKLDIDASATMRRPNGKRTPLTRNDLSEVLERAYRSADGTYRAAAGRLLAGKVLGPFRYENTRPDDPNDIVPHEHRRELRALRVFGAWTNLTDLKAGNTLDTLVTVDGVPIVRHYLQDVGSTFGIGANGPHDWDEGWEYFYQGDATVRRMATLGFALSPWQTAPIKEYPAIGRFEAERFDPKTWKPHTPTTAFMEMREDDAFWAARRVAAVGDEMIRAGGRGGEVRGSGGAGGLAAVLMQRRDKIARAYLPAINPIVNPKLSESGSLTFENAAVEAHVAEHAPNYHAAWFQFDNATGETRPIGPTRSTTTTTPAPSGLPSTTGSFVAVDLSGDTNAYPTWREPVRVYFRRATDGWSLVGIDRQADRAATEEPRRTTTQDGK